MSKKYQKITGAKQNQRIGIFNIITFIIALVGAVPNCIDTYHFFSERPRLVSNLHYIDVGNIEENGKIYTAFLLALVLSNPSDKAISPSKFECYIKNNNDWIQLDRREIPERMSFDGEFIPEFSENPNKSDLQKTFKSIKNEQPIIGFLFFRTDKLTLEEYKKINRKGKFLKLELTDNNNQKFESEIDTSNLNKISESTNFPKVFTKTVPNKK